MKNVKTHKAPTTDYSRMAKYYDKVRPTPAHNMLNNIIKYGGINNSSYVLDIGCGTGRYLINMPVNPHLFCALEPSIDMLKQALEKDKPKRRAWVQGDGQNLPFKSNTFTCTYMTLVLHHIEDKPKTLKEIHRTLRPNGNLVVMTISHQHVKKGILSLFPGVTFIDLKRVPSIPSITKMMKTIGYRNIHYHPYEHDEGATPTEQFLERVKNKYISTLTLLPEEQFQRGYKIFEQRIRRKFGKTLRRTARFVYITANK